MFITYLLAFCLNALIPSHSGLPGDVAEFAIADSCLACFDYTNSLADVVVGYMAAPMDDNGMDQSYQTITVRNFRGEEMIQSALAAGRIELGPDATGKGSHENFAMATVSSDNLVQLMIGGEMKDQGMPQFLGNIMASVLTSVGPKGTRYVLGLGSIHIHSIGSNCSCANNPPCGKPYIPRRTST